MTNRFCALCVALIDQNLPTRSIGFSCDDRKQLTGVPATLLTTTLAWLTHDPTGPRRWLYARGSGLEIPVIAVTTVRGTDSCALHVGDLLSKGS